MAKMIIPSMVEGGKAVAGAQLASTLGPAGVNISDVISKINEKTSAFEGMQVPVKIIVDKSTRPPTVEIEVGTPPIAALVKKEIGVTAPVKEEAGVKGKKPIGNITIEQLVKICKSKTDSSLAKTTKTQVKEACGTCLSLGVTVEGKSPKEVFADIESGKYDKLLK
jgi:large subunit ribosomal protein L11